MTNRTLVNEHCIELFYLRDNSRKKGKYPQLKQTNQNRSATAWQQQCNNKERKQGIIIKLQDKHRETAVIIVGKFVRLNRC